MRRCWRRIGSIIERGILIHPTAHYQYRLTQIPPLSSTSPFNTHRIHSPSTTVRMASSSAPSGASFTGVTRQRYFGNSLLHSLPIVGLEEGEAVVVVQAEPHTQPTQTTAASSSPSHVDDSSVPLDFHTFHVSSTFLCTTCRVAFETGLELRTHSKTPWHIRNLRAKQNENDKIVSEEEFTQMEAEEAKERAEKEGAEDSASSGSDTAGSEAEADVAADDDDRPTVGASKVTFYTPTQKLSVWKSLLQTSTTPSGPLHLRAHAYASALRALPSQDQIAIFMMSGGRFSGAVFKRDQMLVHKNFQRYTTRRKQGGSQSAHDNAKGAAKSIGSSIRRKETVRYQEETQRIIEEWDVYLKQCSLIFLFAPSSNRIILSKCGLLKSDDRIKNIPFPTYRPTLEEVKRVHTILSTVEFVDRVNVPYDLENLVAVEKKKTQTHTPTSTSTANTSASAASTNVVSSSPPVSALSSMPEAVVDDMVLNMIRGGSLEDLQAAVISGYTRTVQPGDARFRPLLYECVARGGEVGVAMLAWLLKSSGIGELDVNEQVLDPEDATHIVCWSALHKASKLNDTRSIELLLTHGANPTLRDSRSRLPLPLISNPATRLEIRKFAGRPEFYDRFNWKDAEWQPLTDEMEQAQEEARKAKAKEKKAKAKLRDKERKVEEAAAAARAVEHAEEELRLARQAQAIRDSAALVQQASSQRAQVIGAMSDREKRALAAERRLGAAAGTGIKCQLCKNPITKTPFQRLTFNYCTMQCLQAHTAELNKTTPNQTHSKATTFNPK